MSAGCAFSLDADGFTQIDVPGASWTRIFGINPQGDVVGSYADGSGCVHAFLLRGRPQDPNLRSVREIGE